MVLSYEFYKVLHLTALFCWVATISFAFGSKSKTKGIFIAMGLSSFIALVGGMGLLARLGVKHLGPWPQWAFMKLMIWLAISFISHIVIKRGGSMVKLLSLILILTLCSFGAYLAIFKI